jgi:hypothetical protein
MAEDDYGFQIMSVNVRGINDRKGEMCLDGLRKTR